MSKQHVLDELSAYIDGEAKTPQRIARHLQACETCARRHMQLLKLSAHLRGMAAPEVRPEFLTRVMARAAETKRTPSRQVQAFGRRQMAVAAVLVLCVGLAVTMWLPGAHQSEAERIVAESVKWNDEDALMAELEYRLAQGEDLSLFAVATASDDPFASVSLDEVIMLLAAASIEEYESEASYAEADVFEMLENMGQEEEAQVRDLLAEYMNEG